MTADNGLDFDVDGTGLKRPWVFNNGNGKSAPDKSLMALAHEEAMREAVAVVENTTKEAHPDLKAKHYHPVHMELLKKLVPELQWEPGWEVDKDAFNLHRQDAAERLDSAMWNAIQTHAIAQAVDSVFAELPQAGRTYAYVYRQTEEYALRAAAHRGLKGAAKDERPGWKIETHIEALLRGLSEDEGKVKLHCCISGDHIKLSLPGTMVRALLEEMRDYLQEHPEVEMHWSWRVPEAVIDRLYDRIEANGDLSKKQRSDLEDQVRMVRKLKRFKDILEDPDSLQLDHMGPEAHERVYGANAPNDWQLPDGSYRYSDLRDILKYPATQLARKIFKENPSISWGELRASIYECFSPVLYEISNLPGHIGAAGNIANNADSVRGTELRRRRGPEHLNDLFTGDNRPAHWDQKLQELLPGWDKCLGI